jgi:ubiquinone/menaquinone biosynthesis C-methylase UbiE
MQATREKGYKGLPMSGPLARWYAQNTAKNIEQFREAARRVAARVPGGSDILEVAPGPGYFAVELAKLGPYRIVGLDISQTFVTIATENAKKGGVAVEFRHGNASSMPFEPGSFDFIYCRAAFKNFSEPIEAINEMHRVLKPGGEAVIVDLRKDTSTGEIDAAVATMGLSRINSTLTKLIFKHSLLKRAYLQEEFRRMVAQTPFVTCEIEVDSIGMEISLRKSPSLATNLIST